MNHAEHLVDLIDENGRTVGNKQRQEINKSVDLYHTVFVVLCTPDHKLILSKIPERTDLPNVYAGRLGATVATIRRHNETPDEAGIRAVNTELFIKTTQLKHLGDTYLILPDGHRNYMSVYKCTHTMPEDFSNKDIETLQAFSQGEFDNAIGTDKGKFSLTFLAIWQKYQENLLSD